MIASFLLALLPLAGQGDKSDLHTYIKSNYSREAHKIRVRDGVNLFTIIYRPKDTTKKYPILLNRTPYGVAPYEDNQFRASLGPNQHFAKEGYIFAYQDVRGRFLSEGVFENMRPHNPDRKGPKDIDESTDTYDTVDYLVKTIAGNNGKVGLYGISYPGFYSSAGMIDAHPALKAVSPQAPIADWFFDDFYHHGAFFLPHAFNFFTRFGDPRPEPTTKSLPAFKHGTPDGYQFFLDIGPLKNARSHFPNQNAFWYQLAKHTTYDDFWKARNLLPHLKKVAPAVMTVGGWFDAEDLYGALKTYAAVEKQNPGIDNRIVMGPWTHGGWSRSEPKLGDISWNGDPSEHYQKKVEIPFFRQHLKGNKEDAFEAMMFETGTNRWRAFPVWPPKAKDESLHLHPRSRLAFEPSKSDEADSFISDPNRPVPFSDKITAGMHKEYMVEDQRFAARRTDVLVYQTDPLTRDVTVAGPILADLLVSTTGTDADWIVKVIDVLPPGYKDGPREMGGYQMHLRSEVIRGRFRKSYSEPEPFTPNEKTSVKLELQDVLHTFRKGHRIMVQISSTWFPLVDRNPQKYVPNIFEADADDFQAATHRVHHGSKIRIGVIE